MANLSHRNRGAFKILLATCSHLVKKKYAKLKIKKLSHPAPFLCQSPKTALSTNYQTNTKHPKPTETVSTNLFFNNTNQPNIILAPLVQPILEILTKVATPLTYLICRSS